MATVGFVTHSARPAARDRADQAVDWLTDLGHDAFVIDTDAPDAPERAARFDLAVSMGGDGTMLRTVGLVGPSGVPVLGVNFGTLGYLTVVEPDGLFEALRRYLAGDHFVEARSTLDVAVTADGASAPVLRRTALNDVVLQRRSGGHTVRVAVALNGTPFVSYAADSVIVATPTGSTAYNLSARGPIVSPRARVVIVTPVAPHSLFDRSLVLDATEEVAVTPIAGTVAELVIDGWAAGAVVPGQQVTCAVGTHDACFVTFAERGFEGILRRKFNLAED